MRWIMIARRADAMRRLAERERWEAIAAAPNVIGYRRFFSFTANVRRIEADLAVSISNSRVTA